MATRHALQDPKIREVVASPLGDLITEEEALRLARSCSGLVITVGDVVSKLFLSNRVRPHIVVFDERTHRRSSGRFPSSLLHGYRRSKAENPPGTVSLQAYEELKRLIRFSGESALRILGEEDLLGLPAIELAPVGSLVFYGQPDMGIVAVKVDRESKNVVKSILARSRVS